MKSRQNDHDITNSLAFYRMIFRKSQIAMAVYNSSGQVIEANESMGRLIGSSRDDVLSQNYNQLESWRNSGLLDTAKCAIKENAEKNKEESVVTTFGRYITINYHFIPFTVLDQEYLLLVISDVTERKKAENALQKSEQKFRSLVELTSDWIWEADENMTYTYASPQIERLLGYQPQDLVGKLRPFDLMPPDEAKRILEIAEGINAARRPFYGLESVCTHKDGHPVVLESRGVPYFDEDGDLLGYRGIDRDITVRKQTEENLAKMAREWQTTFDTTSDGIFLMDSDMRIVRINKSANRMFAHADAELEGKFCWEVVHGTKEPIPNCLSIRAKESCSCEIMELPVDEKWYRVTMDPIFDSDKKFVGGVHIFTDITESKRLTEKLRHSEEKYKFLAEYTADIIFTLDLGLNVTYVSPSIEKVLGFTPEERKQMKLEEAITPDSVERVMACFADEVEREKMADTNPDRLIVIETENYHRNGTTVWFENVIKVIRNEKGHLIGIFGTARDITDRKKMGQALIEEKKRLEKAIAEIKKLSGLLPICSSCKKIRDDKGYWSQIESYISSHSEAEFSHSICPECARKLYPELYPDLYNDDGSLK